MFMSKKNPRYAASMQVVVSLTQVSGGFLKRKQRGGAVVHMQVERLSMILLICASVEGFGEGEGIEKDEEIGACRRVKKVRNVERRQG